MKIKTIGKRPKLLKISRLKGASFYRAGEFKKAKAIYQNLSSKEGKIQFCQCLGDAWRIMTLLLKRMNWLLKIDPDFKEAKENLIVAKARKILKEPGNDGEQGVGELGADEIVYDNKAG